MVPRYRGGNARSENITRCDKGCVKNCGSSLGSCDKSYGLRKSDAVLLNARQLLSYNTLSRMQKDRLSRLENYFPGREKEEGVTRIAWKSRQYVPSFTAALTLRRRRRRKKKHNLSTGVTSPRNEFTEFTVIINWQVALRWQLNMQVRLLVWENLEVVCGNINATVSLDIWKQEISHKL